MPWHCGRLKMRILSNVTLVAFLFCGVAKLSCAELQQDQPKNPQDETASHRTQAPQDQTTTSQPNASPNTGQQASPNANSNAAPGESSPDSDHPVLKRRPAKKITHKKIGTGNTSGKVIVRNGGAKEGTPQLSPGTTKEQQNHSRENTEQLLVTTDSNLKSVAGRQLTPGQQSMVEQINTYVRQSKAAAGAGDLSRAHTLAFKAHLLSDELAKK
jgi:hypothetical protein